MKTLKINIDFKPGNNEGALRNFFLMLDEKFDKEAYMTEISNNSLLLEHYYEEQNDEDNFVTSIVNDISKSLEKLNLKYFKVRMNAKCGEL